MSEILLHTKLRELEEELKAEKEVRIRYEKELSNLKLDYADLDAQLQEAFSARDREIDVSKKLRQEIADLKLRVENSVSENEESVLLLKRKHQEQINEFSNHIEQLSKNKFKFEKENKSFLLQLEDLRKENDNLSRIKAQALATSKDLENRQIESTQRIDELLRQLNDCNELKNKLAKEHSELYRRNSNIEFELQQLTLNNKRLAQELDDARMQLENEILVRNSLENKSRGLQSDLDNAQAQLEEETEARLELNKQLIRFQDEFKTNKDKIEKECEARIEDVEDSKRKLNNRHLELQDQFNELMNKLTNNEKTRLRLQNQVDNLSTDLDKTKKRADESLKHEKQLEKENEELKTKLSLANAELDAAFQASRNHQSELSKYKHLSQQLSEQLDALQKDKRRITDELELNTNQLLDAQSRLNETERKLKSIEADRQLTQNDLDDTRDALQLEIQRNQNLQSNLDKLKTDLEKKLADKEDEIDLLRANNRRQLEAAQSQLEDAENRHKNDLNQYKKKLQAELDDLRSKFENAKKAKLDAETQLKKLQQSHKEVLDRLTEEQHMHDATRDHLSSAEKRATSCRAEMEEAKSLLERSDKARKTLELEYHDLEDKLNDTQSQLNRAIAEKKKFESDAISASDELHEFKFELKNAEEKIRALNACLLKKEEDIRHEKEVANEIDASKKAMEQQLKDTLVRIEEAEEFAKREAKRLSSKLESRLVQLETELDLAKSKEQEMSKEMRRLEKRNKDLLDQIGEEQAKLISMTDAYDKIQDKMKKYKGQIEVSEEQVAVNVSKCKRLQRELEDAEDRAESMARTFLRASSVNRNTDNNYDSDYGEAEPSTAPPVSHTPNYLRSSYLYSKPTSIDDYSAPKSTSSWRSKYKTIDIDDDDILIQPRYNKYSSNSFGYPVKSRVWSYGSGRNDRARSVAHIYDQELALNNLNSHKSKSNLYASRNSVSRIYEDLDEPIPLKTTNQRQSTGKYYNPNNEIQEKPAFKLKSQTPDFDKRSDIEKRISIQSENSITPTPEALD